MVGDNPGFCLAGPADTRVVKPSQILIPDKHALPGLAQGGTSESCLDCAPNRPGVAEKEISGELDSGQYFPVSLLILAGNFLPEMHNEAQEGMHRSNAGNQKVCRAALSTGSETSKKACKDCVL